MLNDAQMNHLVEMDEKRLAEYLKRQSPDAIVNIRNSLDARIQDADIAPKDKEQYLTVQGVIEALHVSPVEEYIDPSVFSRMTSQELTEILGLTIKRDNDNKLISFLAMLSAYTKDSQFNLSFNAPSSSGKTFIPVEVAQLFPTEDVVEVGYCSPTSFFHDKAVYSKETNELTIDFQNKILIFLDQPHTLLLQHLRPLLSHDKNEIRVKITDKSQKAGLRTKVVVLRNFPAVVFCSAGLRIDEQEGTRFILLSPDLNQEKIREAIIEKIRRTSDNYGYRYALETNPARQLLKKRIRAIKQERITDVNVEQINLVQELLFDRIKILKPRHQRDTGRILGLVKVFALLNVWYRKREGTTLHATEDDIHEAFQLWDTISASQELNIPPYVYGLYQDVILKAFTQKNEVNVLSVPQGLCRQEILRKHFEEYGRHLSDWQLRKELLPMLEVSGLIYQESDQNDKRKLLVYPTVYSTTSPETNNSGTDGVVSKEIV